MRRILEIQNIFGCSLDETDAQRPNGWKHGETSLTEEYNAAGAISS